MNKSSNNPKRKNGSRTRSRRRAGKYTGFDNEEGESYTGSNGNDKMLKDDIPQFANFDPVSPNRYHQEEEHHRGQPTRKQPNSPINTTANRHYHQARHHHCQHKKHRDQASPMTRYTPSPPPEDSAYYNKSTGTSMKKATISEYDSTAASDFKWAKAQAASQLKKIISPVKTSNNPSIRNPINASIGRSISAGRSNGNHSTNRARDRSITPTYTNAYHENDFNDGGKDFKTRARSRSPAPISMKNRTNKNGTPMRGDKNNDSRIKSRPIITSSKRNMESSHRKQHTKEEIRLRNYYEKKDYTFQNPLDELVTVRVYDLASRIAFEKSQSVSISDLEEVAFKPERGDNASSSMKQDRMKKLSPSPQYVELLNDMNKISSTRQLCWSPNVSRESDPFDGWQNDESDDEPLQIKNKDPIQRELRKKILLKKKRKRTALSKYGLRCSQIDPVEYVENTLLDHAPLLTNIRRRLPMRSDVGFPNATKEEINLKQQEIAKEAQLEEVSPRLIVMLNSNDVGTPLDSSWEKMLDEKVLRRLKYKLPGMPFASKEMYMLRNIRNQPSIALRNDQQHERYNRILPDPYSIFAPPIDSLISSTEMWRSKPFSDRPAGMSYSIAIPVDVKFATGNIEPLVCTLALYCLPKETNSDTKAKGKISEDFVFPAGAWGDILEQKAGEILARQFGLSDSSIKGEREGKRRRNKALFAFDPSSLPRNSHDGIDSLFLVMNVNKVTHRDAGLNYICQSSMRNIAYSSKKTINGLFSGVSGNTSFSSRNDTSYAKKLSKNAFEAFGSQFLTPFCFGILPLFPIDEDTKANRKANISWPNGVSQTMMMFSHPNKPESHDEFVERISVLSRKRIIHSQIIDEIPNSFSNADSMSFDDDSNIIAVVSEESTNSQSIGQKRRKNKFKFRKRKSKGQLFDMTDIFTDDTYLIDGTAIFFTSQVSADFSQTLLHQPLFLQHEVNTSSIPRLLVDACGDSAIMLKPDQDPSSRKKRSNLIRLPPSSKVSGYADSSEIREILYLPHHSDIKYDSSPCFIPRTSLNLLYLFPRLIRKKADEQKVQKGVCYTVKIRIVQQSLSVDPKSGSMIPIYGSIGAIYSPAPDRGLLLESVYTKIPCGSTGKHFKVNMCDGIPLQDEIKIRLPTVLDGTYYLHFTLYSISLSLDDDSSGGMIQSFEGETYIPLTSISKKDSLTRKRVTTVIPNGLHRVEIESFQFQVASRLVSSIHISDPAVATIVRDFSSADYSFIKTPPDIPADYLHLDRILSGASEQAVYHNFYILAFLHLRALVKFGINETDSKARHKSPMNKVRRQFLRSLFTLVTKIKKRFSEKEDGQLFMKKFVKTFMDNFDELIFHSNHLNLTALTSSQSTSNISVESDHELDHKDTSILVNTQSMKEIGNIEKHIIVNHIDEKILFARYADNAVPFSRTAYGVSKIDRMKAEAELYEEGQMMTELYDDDETVFTASTWQSHPNLVNSTNSSKLRPIITQSLRNNPTLSQFQEDQSEAASIVSARETIDISTPFERARSMAKKVNLVAQIFTAPCTAPDLDGSIQSPVRRQLSRVKRSRPPINDNIGGLVSEYQQAAMIQDKKKRSEADSLNLSGSDAEDELKTSLPEGGRLRGLHTQHHELTFSPAAKTQESIIHEPFLYEIFLIMWLHVSKQRKNEEMVNHQDLDLFISNIDFVLPVCLKSIALRCLSSRQVPGIVPSNMLDTKHLRLLTSLVETLASSFVSQALEIVNVHSVTFVEIIEKSDLVLEFLAGLFALIHPSQIAWLTSCYLKTLRMSEEGLEVSTETASLVLTKMHANRQLRLRAAEKLSSMPRFVPLNFPNKFQSYHWEGSNDCYSWMNQVPKSRPDDFSTNGHITENDKMPSTNWLADLVLNECFTICSQSCETITNKSIQQVQNKISSKAKSAIRQRIPVSNEDLAHNYSIGYQSIYIAYDAILRVHATDSRYQSGEATSRIAGMFAASVIENTLEGVQCLSKLESGDKIRNTWLLCFLYMLQESPETVLRQQMQFMCTAKSQIKESRLNRFIRVLKLCTTSFQSFADSQYVSNIAPWLLQESFNTISAASILLVDECYDHLSHSPYERTKLVEGILDLLLRIISAPLSSVTLLRALGAASQVLDKVGTSFFLSAVEDDLQHWGRMLLSSMNSTSLSVRSMSVDLIVSLFGSLFKEDGNIDEVGQVFLTVLPEVVAREIALYSIDGLITNVDSIESSLWPLRRALADVEEADPLDDDRVDTQLSPFLGQFCRACQAIIDGVLIELRLKGNECTIVDTRVNMITGKLKSDSGEHAESLSWAFDADEESLFEAVSFFLPETSPLQRIRWLFTLKRLHEAKGQWVEAGETLILCAKTVAEAIPHVRNVWRPSEFLLWTSESHAPWLSTIGVQTGQTNINDRVMIFAHTFLEPTAVRDLVDIPSRAKDYGCLPLPNIPVLCKILTMVAKESLQMYDKEKGMDPLSYARLEELLKIVMGFVEDHALTMIAGNRKRSARFQRSQNVEEIAMLRKVSATINELVTKMAERMLLLAEQRGSRKAPTTTSFGLNLNNEANKMELFFVKVQLLGKKPNRFLESTTIPTFLDWNIPYICRVPSEAVKKAMNSDRYRFAKKNMKSGTKLQEFIGNEICIAFAEPYVSFLEDQMSNDQVQFCVEYPDEREVETNKSDVFVVVSPVRAIRSSRDNVHQTKKFQYLCRGGGVEEITVANHFPCALSRQATLITRTIIEASRGAT